MRLAAKGALALLGMAIGVPLVIFAWLFVDYNFFYPRQYSRLQTEATEWNDRNWEKGFALRVTVQITSRTAQHAVTADETLVCYEKTFASPGGIKGPPSSGRHVYSDGATVLALPFGPAAKHLTPLRDVCQDTLKHCREWTLPYVTESHYYWSYIVPNDRSFQCFLGNDPRTTLGEASRPAFVAIKPILLSDVMDRTAYLSLPKDQDRQDFLALKSYSWWLETNERCWRDKPIDACAPEVEAVCGRLLR
jgi:hypothetical protein